MIIRILTLAVAMTFASCGAIEKASERDVEVGDFDFTVTASAKTATRADGDATRFTGSRTITRDELLGGSSVDPAMIKSAAVGAASIEVRQELAGATVATLSLTCDGVTPVTLTNVPVADIGSAAQTALTAFAGGLFMRVVSAGSATVAVDATFSEALSEETVDYIVGLEDIVVRAGLDL